MIRVLASTFIAGSLVALPPPATAASPPAEREIVWQRPGPRMTAPAVLADQLMGARQLFADGDSWLVRMDDGRLLRVSATGEQQLVRSDLPGGITLHRGEDGTFYGAVPDGIVRLDPGAITRIAEGQTAVRALVVRPAQLYWLSGEETATLYGAALPDGEPFVIAPDLGLVDALYVREDGYLLGISGEEPRGLLFLDAADGSVTSIAESRFFTREFLPVGANLYLLMDTGNGWLHRLDEGAPPASALELLVIAHGGSRHLAWTGVAFYWSSNGAIYRWQPPDGEPEAVALDTRPVDLVVRGGKATWLESYRGQLLQLPVD